ncbi:MAG: nucleotide exchange factor GrpE [Propionicimonas sp.]|nr:nucleotide exchange factor GrpE [Propionicimonas sp.]
MSEPTYPNGSTPDEVSGEQVTPDQEVPAPGAPAADEGRAAKPGPTVHDRRRVDPKTGQPRRHEASGGEHDELPDAGPVVNAKVCELEELVAERTADLQRLQAEYANYKKRVDRDRALSRQGGVEAVVTDLLPVMDSIEAAREHDELVGGFKLVADELEKLAIKYGLEVYGEVGEVFDPQVHEALMHMPYPGEDEITETTVSAVMQKGVRINDRILRPARVAVADPQ